MAPDDEQLMGRVRRGDEGSLGALVRRHSGPLLSFVTRMARDRAEAEDLFQEVWIAVWVHRASFDATRRFKPWLYRIAANKCADARRRRRAWASSEIVASNARAGAGCDRLAQEESLAAVDRAIGSLGDMQREVVTLRLFASLRYAEIAAVLGVSESTVRSHMCHALRTLRGALAPWAERGCAGEAIDERARAGE